MCSDRSMEVELSPLLGNFDQQTADNKPFNQSTNTTKGHREITLSIRNPEDLIAVESSLLSGNFDVLLKF